METALAAVAQDDDALLGEAADLLYHLLVLLRSRGLGLREVESLLRAAPSRLRCRATASTSGGRVRRR